MSDPFDVLRCAPTLDEGAIRRAYYAELRLHPPHQDPDGFKRLREAYEVLLDPKGRAASFLAVPTDAAALRARYDALFAEPLAAAREAKSETERVQRFVEGWSALSWSEAIAKAQRR
jgi:curved DNA-binding protein CbpA